MSLIFIDHDAIPVSGFTWIHWTVANIDPSVKELPENASIEQNLLEGVTSWNSPIIAKDRHLSREDATGYGGCSPPDQPHLYMIKLYALDTVLNLERGFYLNEMLKAMEGHVLDKSRILAVYPNRCR